MHKTSIIGIDLAKHVFQIHKNDHHGHTEVKKQLKRHQVLDYLAKQPKTLVAMEACGGSHYWARAIKELGHDVKVIPAQYVKPFVQVNKNDARDAQAIAEAAARPNIKGIAVKSVEQQDLQAIHRIRERLTKERTAISNEIRGLLGEYGEVIPKGSKAIKESLMEVLEDAENGLSHRIRQLLNDLRSQWLERDARVTAYTSELEVIAKNIEACSRLQSIPGIGPVNATLLFSYMGDPNDYEKGRNFSASLGLVPKQSSSGGKDVMLGISKQGNKHVRKQLVHGARSAYKVLVKMENSSRLSEWVKRQEGKHPNKIIVALANKIARIAWALMKNGGVYQAS